jgi:hypothetical protein
LGVLVVGPAAATTDVDDVDGGPPGGCWRQVRQRPPPMLKTSMVGPPGFHGDNEVSFAKKMLVVTSDPGGCWPSALAV